MQSKYSILLWILISLVGISVTFLYQGITIVSSIETIPVLHDGETEVIIEEAGTYYFMYEHDWNVRHFEYNQFNEFGRVGMFSGTYDIMIQNLLTQEYYELVPLDDNTSISMNNKQVGGTIEFDTGTYLFTIIETDNWGNEFVAFSIAKTGVVGGILMIVFSSLVSVASFILFMVFYSKRRTLIQREIEFDGYTYQSQDSTALFGIEDDFFDPKD